MSRLGLIDGLVAFGVIAYLVVIGSEGLQSCEGSNMYEPFLGYILTVGSGGG